MTYRTRQLIKTTAILFGVVTILLASGCAVHPNASASAILNGSSSIRGYQDGIDVVADNSTAGPSDKKTIHTLTGKTRDASKSQDSAVANWQQYDAGLQSQLDWYHNNKLVRLAVFIWYSLWWVCGICAVIVIGGAFAGLNPLGIGYHIVTWIGDTIPLGQIAKWPRDIVIWLRGLKVLKEVVPAVVETIPPTQPVIGANP